MFCASCGYGAFPSISQLKKKAVAALKTEAKKYDPRDASSRTRAAINAAGRELDPTRNQSSAGEELVPSEEGVLGDKGKIALWVGGGALLLVIGFFVVKNR